MATPYQPLAVAALVGFLGRARKAGQLACCRQMYHRARRTILVNHTEDWMDLPRFPVYQNLCFDTANLPLRPREPVTDKRTQYKGRPFESRVWVQALTSTERSAPHG